MYESKTLIIQYIQKDEKKKDSTDIYIIDGVTKTVINELQEENNPVYENGTPCI